MWTNRWLLHCHTNCNVWSFFNDKKWKLAPILVKQSLESKKKTGYAICYMGFTVVEKEYNSWVSAHSWEYGSFGEKRFQPNNHAITKGGCVSTKQETAKSWWSCPAAAQPIDSHHHTAPCSIDKSDSNNDSLLSAQKKIEGKQWVWFEELPVEHEVTLWHLIFLAWYQREGKKMDLQLQKQAAIPFVAKRQKKKKWCTLSTSRVREEGRSMGLEAWDK